MSIFGGKELRLEAPHLAGGLSLLRNLATADNPAHRRFMAKALAVVNAPNATEAAEAAEDGLSKQPCQRSPAISRRRKRKARWPRR